MTIVAPPNPESRKIQKYVTDLERRIKTVEAGLRTAQLSNSSIHGGGVDVYDPFGTYRGRVGMQPDGTSAFVSENPLPPPVPSAPSVTPGTASLIVKHSGETQSGEGNKADFSHINVYTADPGLPEVRTFRGNISPVPGEFPITGLDYTNYLVTVTAVNYGGKESGHSQPTSGAPSQVVSADLINGIIQEVHLNNGIVGAAVIKANAVTATKISDTAIETRHLTAGSVDTNALATNSVNAAKIVAGSITTEKIAALAITANELAANSVTAGKIQAGSVTAVKLEANMVIATRIIAGTLNGARVEMHPTMGIQAFQSNGTTRTFWIDASTGNVSIIGTLSSGTSGDRVVINPEGSSLPEIVFYTTIPNPAFINSVPVQVAGSGTDGVGIGINSSPRPGASTRKFTLFVRPDLTSMAYTALDGVSLRGGEVYADALRGRLSVYSNSTGAVLNYLDVTGAEVTALKHVRADFFVSGGAAHMEKVGGSGPVYMSWNGQVLSFIEEPTGITLKNFVIPHPTPEKTESHWLVHACTESPHGGVEYWGTATIEDGKPEVVKLPDYFEDLTSDDNRVVLLTVMQPSAKKERPKRRHKKKQEELMIYRGKVIQPPRFGIPQVAATYPENGEFEIHTDGTAPETFEVHWLVKAVRKDVPPLTVEPARDSVRVGGAGPYRYIES